MSNLCPPMTKPRKTPRPPWSQWAKAKLYQADLYNLRWPVCGTRYVWVVEGYKWVKLCTPIQHDKWRISRDDWDATPKEART